MPDDRTRVNASLQDVLGLIFAAALLCAVVGFCGGYFWGLHVKADIRFDEGFAACVEALNSRGKR